MPFDPIYLIYGGIFLGVLLFIEGIYYLTSDIRGLDRNPNRRLRMLASGIKREDVMVKLRRDKRVGAGGPLGWLDTLAVQSGRSITTPQLLLLMGGLVLVLGVLTFVARMDIVFMVAAPLIFGIVVPILFLMWSRRSRLKKFGQQLPEAIEVSVRSLRAGHPLPTAIGLVAREMPDPIGSAYGTVVDEITYGLDLEHALTNMAERIGHEDLRFLVVAISIQSNVGGNLAEILSNLARLIRERHRMKDKIRALSAEGRFSAVFLSVLPPILMGIIHVMNPDYYGAVASHEAFLIGLGVAAVMMAFGDFIMYKMVNFRV